MKTNEEVKQEILNLFSNAKRTGMKDLLAYLQSSDYFTAPAAMLHHDNEIGGLARHSLTVYKIFKDKVEYYGIPFPEDSIKVCGLLHDICKVDCYKQKIEKLTTSQLNYLRTLVPAPEFESLDIVSISKSYASKLIDFYKNGGDFPKREDQLVEWNIEDDLPLGHGEKSVFILQRFLQLTNEEACIVRWHMSFSEAGVHFRYPSGISYERAMELYPTVIILFTSDFEARMVADIIAKNK